MKKISLFWGGLLTLTSVCAQPSQPRLPANHYWHKMNNGLEVVVIENSKVPLVTIEIGVKNGAYTEGPEYSGLSHLYEHMFFKANNEYPNQAKLIERIQELGMVFSATTGNEFVNYFFTFDKDSLDAGLRFMNAAIRFPVFAKEDMLTERPVVDGEFQRAESDPFQVLYLEVEKLCWGELMSRKNPIGTHEIINSATPEKMMVIKDRYYHPNNSILVVSGDIKHDDVIAKAEQIFAGWQASDFDPIEKYPIPEFIPIKTSQFSVIESSLAETPTFLFEWHGPDFRNDSLNTIVADLFSAVLRLNSSKWHQAIVERGLASWTNFIYITQKYVGPVGVFIIPIPAKMKECYEEVFNQISHFKDENYFTDDQIATAKEILRRTKIRTMEKPSYLTSYVTYFWASTSLNYMTDYFDAMSRVTKAQLAAYAQKYIVDKPFVAGMILNKEMNAQYKPADFFK
jgi:zinc protease